MEKKKMLVKWMWGIDFSGFGKFNENYLFFALYLFLKANKK